MESGALLVLIPLMSQTLTSVGLTRGFINFPFFSLIPPFPGKKSPLFLVFRVEPNLFSTLKNAIAMVFISITTVLNKVSYHFIMLKYMFKQVYVLKCCLSPREAYQLFFFQKSNRYIFLGKKIVYLYSFSMLLQLCYILGNIS